MRKYFLTFILIVFVLSFSATLFSQGDSTIYYKKKSKDTYLEKKGINDNLQITIGTYLPSLDTNIQVDSLTYGTGTLLNFETDLGMDDSLVVFRIDGHLRLGRHVKLEFGYYNLYRDIFHTLNKQIQIGNDIYTANADISGHFQTETIKGAIGFSIINDGNVEIGISIGANIVFLDIELVSLIADVNQTIDQVAPLPLAGLYANITLMPGLFLKGNLQFVAVTIEDIEGSSLDLRAVFEYYPLENLGFGAGINIFNFDLSNVEFDIESEPVIGAFNYSYTGLVGYISLVL